MSPSKFSAELNTLINGEHGEPYKLLGPHQVPNLKSSVLIRAFRPQAHALTAINAKTGTRYPMKKVHDAGLFEAQIRGKKDTLRYTLEEETYESTTHTFEDPYAYTPSFTDYDVYIFSEGHSYYAYRKMGAHIREEDGVTGINFAVWAPNAYRVSVVGDFNRWDARVHPMHLHGDSGLWELFIPGVEAGAHYKFDIRSHNMGYHAEKTDPYGYHSEVRPHTASIVADLSTYQWEDNDWMEARPERNFIEEPMSIYEVHLGSWRRRDGYYWLTYREMAKDLIDYVKYMGYTHIELLPVSEHPLDMSWGYQVTGYYAPTSRFGDPDDFMYFVDQCHQNDIGVILDWVPAHFPKDGHALSYFDGTHLYEHEDSRLGEHPDWGTYIFNYGRSEVRTFLLSNAIFWLKEFHIDGLRVDAVSSMLYLDFGREGGEWLPNEHGSNENLPAVDFLKELNTIVHREVPGAVTIAEESTSWPMVSRPTYLGGLGFTFKWNMGWMHDTLDYIKKDSIYRRYHHNNMTFSMMYAFTENFILSLSHDEVVHGKGSLINKGSGDWWQKFATLRLLMGYQYTHPGKKLLFMGQEFGQWAEWSEARSLDWHLLDLPTHQGAQAWMRDLNQLYKREPALFEQDYTPEGFRWINANDADNSIFSYVRFAKDSDDHVVVVCNFTPVPRENYRIGVPGSGYYKELLNSDAEAYGGGNVGNCGGVYTDPNHKDGFSQSLSITVPPLAIIVFKPEW